MSQSRFDLGSLWASNTELFNGGFPANDWSERIRVGHRKNVLRDLTDGILSFFARARPGIGENAGSSPQFSMYYLVAPWKFGLNHDALAVLSGKSVTLKGTLIYRGNQTMIETKPEWIQASDKSFTASVPETIQLGRQTLVGEIVDSKCFLGVMNPGQLTPHRACAIRCLSGGVPPVLVVRQKNGPAAYLLLVSADGKPVNKNVLDIVAVVGGNHGRG